MRYSILSIVLILILLPTGLFSLSIQFRSFDHPGYTRVVIQSDEPLVYKYRAEDRVVVVDIKGETQEVPRSLPIARSSLLESLNTSRVNGQSRFEIRLRKNARIKSHFVLEKPHRLVFDLVHDSSKRAPAAEVSKAPDPVQPVAPKPAAVETPPPQENKPVVPLAEAAEQGQETEPAAQDNRPELVFRRIDTICIDPGHGGSDLGAVHGSGKVYEKDIVLNIARHLKGLVIRHLGLRVIMTREGDDEVSLNTRVAKANNEKAQLFVSIHLNSDYRHSARGPETFYVSLKATDREAAELAKKENASYDEIEQVAESDDLKMILWNMAQNEYIQESSRLAVDIQEELNELLSTRNRGVKQAPFRVLMRAAMPAVLVEIAFLSNPIESQKIMSESFQLEAAQAVFRGINRFVARYNNTVGE